MAGTRNPLAAESVPSPKSFGVNVHRTHCVSAPERRDVGFGHLFAAAGFSLVLIGTWRNSDMEPLFQHRRFFFQQEDVLEISTVDGC